MTEPDYRFTLANERTFLAWVRTSFALVAGGVALDQYLPDLGPPVARTVVGAALVVLGGVLAALSHRRWRAAQRAMREDRPLPPVPELAVLGYGVALLAMVVLVLVVVS
ncbi:YidH family protein [Actinokineospora soli]|uniref:YidH family protein n=1 Tax=Actinokineospora soli TaxID=1048753 RepID=A0ABW2TIT7_9PSEU